MAATYVQTFIRKLRSAARRRPILTTFRLVVLLVVGYVLFGRRTFWTPDTLFFILLAAFAVFGQAGSFVWRFAPFVILLLVYDSLRGVAGRINPHVHYTEMIHFDQWLFAGHIPSVWLQSYWWNGALSWLDYFFYFFYAIHFVVPVGFAIVLWKFRPRYYWPFVGALVFLSYAAFATYIAYPAAPPWLAAEKGLLGPLHHISSDIWQSAGITNVSELYTKISPNLVAAIPSLHSAYPFLTFLFAVAAFGWRRCGWIGLYPLIMWVGVVYLGEHYVVDVLIGALYAAASFGLAIWVSGQSFYRRWGERLQARTRALHRRFVSVWHSFKTM